jgi:ubiquinone/menaquinone biosynthesis C-methylase UbiE
MADIDAAAWQESWDRQQEAYMPDRDHRFHAMFDVVEAVTPSAAPAILDLAGGTGSISLRARQRFPHATTTLVDVNPVLLAIAGASLDERSTIVTTDLRHSTWLDDLPRRDFDAVLTATALHWIDGERLANLYAEIQSVLRPGGVFINADHMADPGLPALTDRISSWKEVRREARYAAGSVLSWEQWWAHVEQDPTLGPLMGQRPDVFKGLHAVDFAPNIDWHLQALRQAGFTEVGLTWRGGTDAAVTAVR